ncbi:MAG: exodeoxyribonuclease VII large subunit [Gammaproteobacteria bacterium]|nr:exodeoxyribonuclease VII large subunit [Gammaproteobacteria bacterium]
MSTDAADGPRPGGTAGEAVYSVSRLNREARLLLEAGLGRIWVEAEVSNLARPSSGHWYFTLKDSGAQLRCAMFRQRNQYARCQPRDGQQVLARGRISLYEPRGDYQLIVEQLEEAGLGALQRAFEALRERLAAEGLFAPERKRPLPAAPATIGVITSPTGAALRDVLHVLARRCAAARVVIYPVPVQGAAAAPAIAAALDLASARAECAVLILARGGGSLEDLWAFNDERVARAIARCALPVVTGIGHETDFTIADYVADQRAPTPSAAAERVAPDTGGWLAQLARLAARFGAAMQRHLAEDARRLAHVEHRLERAHPGTRLAQSAQQLDEFEQRLLRALRERLQRAGMRVELAARALQAVSPLATLARGFAVLTRTRDGALLTDAATIAPGEEIDARLVRGSLRARVLARSEA